ncbi:hypothetical protein, partial [Pseudomonas sp. RA_35y_Pfl2_P32]|uniref:hypothetical protein n=1 Tax=Pseudomonas sp. RA_35y_Pfl2_P32 TaxID=3088705 RepID=UPI0030D9CB39
MPSSLVPPEHDIQVLRELGIPGRTKDPVSTNPNVWGLNIAAVQDNFPRHGLQCLAGPWGTMGRGDQLVIFWGNNNEVLHKTVDLPEVDTELRLFIDAERIRAGSFDVFYTVRREDQALPEPSDVMKVLVKLTRPGGKDDNDTPGHSKLIMRLPPHIIAG